MTPFHETLLLNAALLLCGMTLLWLLSLALRNASIVDIFWGLGFILVAVASLLWNGQEHLRPLVMSGLTLLWGLRLAGYVAWRNHGQGEDRRYTAMRDAHGGSFWWWSLLSVFWLQAAILWVIALPLQVVNADAGEPFGKPLDLVGIALWAFGFGFETIGDWQLARFKADPVNKGRVMDRSRSVVLHEASQLLWRMLPLVGNLLLGRGRRSVVDGGESGLADDLSAEVFRRRFIGIDDCRTTPGICRVSAADKCLCAVVAWLIV